jgi:hypothetical protein
MKMAHALRSRARLEIVLSMLLAAGIIVALLLPARRSQKADSSQRLFTVVENDYSNPLFSSAVGIQIMNGAAKQFARFAGYDELQTRMKVGEGFEVVNVTRYSGDLLSLLNVGFLQREHHYQQEPCVFISVNLWERLYQRSPEIMGTMLTLNHTTYRIAGVTHRNAGMLGTTDIWMPVRSRGLFGEMTCMRVLGSVLNTSTWKAFEKEFAKTFREQLSEKICSETKGARLLPITEAIQFREGLPVIEVTTLIPVPRRKDYQPAAFPSSRGS